MLGNFYFSLNNLLELKLQKIAITQNQFHERSLQNVLFSKIKPPTE